MHTILFESHHIIRVIGAHFISAHESSFGVDLANVTRHGYMWLKSIPRFLVHLALLHRLRTILGISHLFHDNDSIALIN